MAISRMCPRNPYVTHDEDDFGVDILVGDEDPAVVDNVDVVIRLPGKGRYSATVITLDVIREIMDRHAVSGESLNGRHLVVSDLVIIRTPGVAEIIDVVRDLVKNNEVEATLPHLDDER